MYQDKDKEPLLTARQALLGEASKIVSKDRNTSYGNPEDNFRDIAALQAAYMQGKTGPISPMDVAMLNILQKVARLKFNPGHWDSLVDIAGYAACAAEIQERSNGQNALTGVSPQAFNAAQQSAFNPFHNRPVDSK